MSDDMRVQVGDLRASWLSSWKFPLMFKECNSSLALQFTSVNLETLWSTAVKFFYVHLGLPQVHLAIRGVIYDFLNSQDPVRARKVNNQRCPCDINYKHITIPPQLWKRLCWLLANLCLWQNSILMHVEIMNFWDFHYDKFVQSTSFCLCFLSWSKLHNLSSLLLSIGDSDV